MIKFQAALIALFLLPAVLATAPVAAQSPAKALFGAVATPAGPEAQAIGSYAKGCLAGGVELAADGGSWQAMRLSRHRNFGHPALIDFVTWLAEAAREDGWPGLLVGDMSQPRGGPMDGGHASHQIGLDADLWLTPMPDRTLTGEEREIIGATSMIEPGTRSIDPTRWTEAHARLIRRAALHADVARIFVHPGIKQAMCELGWRDRNFLSKVRPWWGHDSHFHVRLKCRAGEAACVDQAPPPEGDGCGSELAYWLSDEAWKAKDPPDPPAPPLTLADLPDACAAVLEAP